MIGLRCATPTTDNGGLRKAAPDNRQQTTDGLRKAAPTTDNRQRTTELRLRCAAPDKGHETND